MKAKEFYYPHNFLKEKTSSSTYQKCNEDRLDGFLDRIYRFLLKRVYKAEKSAIDYCKQIAYVQYRTKNSFEDQRLISAKSRIVELHYPNLKALVLSLCQRKVFA